MRYLCGSSSVCLQFGRTRDEVTGYVDFDYARDLEKGDPLQDMCSPLEAVLLVGKQLFSLQ